MNYQDEIRAYYDDEIRIIQSLDIDEINAAMNVIVEAWKRGSEIFIFGNGGSAATASHFANDFNKGISEHLDTKFRMHCLCDNFATVMAVANDINYDEVFRFQLEKVLSPDDVVIGISGSGNSKNVLNAIDYAQRIGAITIGITGFDGGKLREIVDYCMHVPVNDMQITEDIHMTFDHMMYRVFSRCLK